MTKEKLLRLRKNCFNCKHANTRPEDPPCDICEEFDEWQKLPKDIKS